MPRGRRRGFLVSKEKMCIHVYVLSQRLRAPVEICEYLFCDFLKSVLLLNALSQQGDRLLRATADTAVAHGAAAARTGSSIDHGNIVQGTKTGTFSAAETVIADFQLVCVSRIFAIKPQPLAKQADYVRCERNTLSGVSAQFNLFAVSAIF